MALTCSRAGCGCGFAQCAEKTAATTRTVTFGRGCPYAKPENQGGVGIKKGEYFCNAAGQWDKVSSKSKAIKLKEYLNTLTEAQRQHALEDCANELRDLKIDHKDLGLAVPVARPVGDGDPMDVDPPAGGGRNHGGWFGGPLF